MSPMICNQLNSRSFEQDVLRKRSVDEGRLKEFIGEMFNEGPILLKLLLRKCSVIGFGVFLSSFKHKYVLILNKQTLGMMIGLGHNVGVV